MSDDTTTAVDATATVAASKPKTAARARAPKPATDKSGTVEMVAAGRTVVYAADNDELAAAVIEWFKSLTVDPLAALPDGATFKE